MNENNRIAQPHDKYAKSILSNVEVARSLIEAHLPPELVKRIDMNSLQLTNKSFVSEELKQLHSDVIYRLNIDNQKGYVYYCIENQSTADKKLPLRILDYNIELMKQHLNEGNEKLPIIINEVIYAGTESPYPYTIDIMDMFENPALANEVMFKPAKMTDLTVKTNEELLQDGIAGLMEVMIKQGVLRDHINFIKNNPQLTYSIVNSIFGYTSVLYFLATGEVSNPEELVKAMVEAAPNKEKQIMTAAAQLIQKGRQEGIEVGVAKGRLEGKLEGRQEGKLETAQNMLQKHLSIELIRDITGLSIEQIKALDIVNF